MTEIRHPWFVSAALLALWGLGCSDTHGPVQGGETHFLVSCDGECDDGLQCVCGVCTQPCEESAQCASLASAATCLPAGSAAECGQQPASAMACDAECDDDAQCEGVGQGLGCLHGRCRLRAQSVGDGVGDGAAASPSPLVLFLVDTSGSTVRKAGCECDSSACTECLPDCAATERSRWTDILEALTGSFDGYACEALDRTEENGASYDLGYYLPFYEVSGAQRQDGVLDTFADDVRFGLATFDGWDTYVGATPLVSASEFDHGRSEGEDGLWSYDPRTIVSPMPERDDGIDPGVFQYHGESAEPYAMDTGIRSAEAAEGALVAAVDPSESLAVNAAIQAQLLAIRPYGGTPTAAAFDDLYYYFNYDPALSEERDDAEREQHVVLITDGYPDDDYRSFGCDCGAQEPADPSACGTNSDPEQIYCPYPTAIQAARRLRCGDDADCAGSAVDGVHVITFDVQDVDTLEVLSQTAEAGGAGLQRVENADELRQALVQLLLSLE